MSNLTNITTLLTIGGIEYDVDFDVIHWPASEDEPAGGEVRILFAEPQGPYDADELPSKDAIEGACWEYYQAHATEL